MALIFVTVVYSPKAREVQEVKLQLQQGATVSDAIQRSAFFQDLGSETIQTLDIGVWGKKVDMQRKLKNSDRVEIYRCLTVDPKVARRERFAKQGARTAGLFAKRRAGAKPGY